MNDDNWYQDSADDEPSYREDPRYASNDRHLQPKTGMSTGVKVLIGCGVIGGVMALLCCGGVAYFGSQFANMMTKDPARVEEIQKEIANIDVPEEFSPTAGADGELLGMSGQAAVYTNGDAVIMLIQVQTPDGASNDQMLEQFQQQLGQQGNHGNFTIDSTEEHLVMIDGEETPIEISKATDQNGKDLRIVRGAFQGRGGAAIIQCFIPEEKWDEDQFIQMVESINTGEESADEVETDEQESDDIGVGQGESEANETESPDTTDGGESPTE